MHWREAQDTRYALMAKNNIDIDSVLAACYSRWRRIIHRRVKVCTAERGFGGIWQRVLGSGGLQWI